MTIHGHELIGPDGKVLHPRGINLGGWLVPEGYMLGFSKAIAPWQIRPGLQGARGTEADNAFWRRWQDTFITRDDIRYIRATGMNIVRVPFDYRLFTPEEYPGTWVGIGFELLDRVVEWSREAGLFVLLDMHAAPCGQNPWNVDYGNPYLYEDPACLSRTVEIWRRIARHFARNRAVIGYDLLNEPAPPEGDNRQVTARCREREDRGGHQGGRRKPPPFRHERATGSILRNFREAALCTKARLTFHSYWTEPTEQAFAQHLQFAEGTMSRSFSASPARTRMNG